MDAVQTPPPMEETAARCRAAAQADPQRLDRLTDQINVYDTRSILTFGAEAAREMAACSDTVLADIQKNQAGDAGAVLGALGRIMEQFDMGELRTEEKKRRFPFGKAPALNQDQILEKYREMGREVDRVYIALKQYEAEVQAYVRCLRTLCDSNLRVYQKLVYCIVAAEQGIGEIQAHIRRREAELARNPGDTALRMDLDDLRRACTLLERRAQDLKVTEIVALQSIPMIQMMQSSQVQLIQKIDTAFLVTLPIFKRALNQEVARKRQRLQAQALEAVDRRAREAAEGRRAPSSAQGAQEDDQALEQARQTILDGIRDARALQQDAGAQQAAGAARLDALRRTAGGA